VTWRAVRAELVRRLDDAGITNAEGEARFILLEVSGYGPDEWLDIADHEPLPRAVARLWNMCDRRVAGEPLQYVLGSWSFRGLDLMVDPRVLIPRPETEWVVEVALEEAVRLGLHRARKRPVLVSPELAPIADLGTGSGAIALGLERELPETLVWATDVSADAAAVARANVAGASATRVRVVEGSWFEALPAEVRGELVLVVANPPYVAEAEVATLPDEVRNHEPRAALVAGPSGLEALDHIVTNAPSWLATRGTLVCEVAPHQATAVERLAYDAGFVDVHIRDDLAGRARVLVARRK
jgi:release factor glutamine methyltransferase